MSTPARHTVPHDVGWTTDEDANGHTRVYAARLPGGPVMVLAGVSGLIWLVAVEGSDSVIEEVARVSDQAVETVSDDVESCLAELVRCGLLTRA